MTTPRSREEIESEYKRDLLRAKGALHECYYALDTILEVLLDIRDALTKKNPTDV